MSNDRPPSPPPGPPSPPEQEARPSAPEQEARTWAMLAHLAGIALFLGPLVVWIAKKDTDEFVADQAREALNFQLTMTIFAVAAFVLSWIPIVNCVSGLVTLAVFLADVVLIILAAVKANDGERYRYPFALRLLG